MFRDFCSCSFRACRSFVCLWSALGGSIFRGRSSMASGHSSTLASTIRSTSALSTCAGNSACVERKCSIPLSLATKTPASISPILMTSPDGPSVSAYPRRNSGALPSRRVRASETSVSTSSAASRPAGPPHKSAPRTGGRGGAAQKIFPGERLVDPDGGFGTLCRCHDREMHVLDCVAGHIDAGDVRGFITTTAHAAPLREGTPELGGEIGLLTALAVKKKRPARQGPTVSQNDGAQRSPLHGEARDGCLFNPDAVLAQSALFAVLERKTAIAEKDNVIGPRSHGPRHLQSALSLSVDRDRCATRFPAVAVGALENALAEKLAKTRNRRNLVEESGREQDLATTSEPRNAEDDTKSGAIADGVGDRAAVERDAAVALYVAAPELEKAPGRDSIAAKVTVKLPRDRVTRMPGVAQKHPAQRPRKHQGCAEPGRPAAHNDDVERPDLWSFHGACAAPGSDERGLPDKC